MAAKQKHKARYIEGITPEQTAHHICMMATAALRQQRFLSQARAIVRHLVTVNLLPFAARYSEMAAVWHWMSKHLRYTSDPVGVELVQGPLALLDQIAEYGRAVEDCDGYTVMSVAMLMALGFECRVTIVTIKPLPGWRHVFCEVQLPRVGWIIFDPSLETRRRNHAMMQMAGDILRFHPDDIDENEDQEA